MFESREASEVSLIEMFYEMTSKMLGPGLLSEGGG